MKDLSITCEADKDWKRCWVEVTDILIDGNVSQYIAKAFQNTENVNNNINKILGFLVNAISD